MKTLTIFYKDEEDEDCIVLFNDESSLKLAEYAVRISALDFTITEAIEDNQSLPTTKRPSQHATNEREY